MANEYGSAVYGSGKYGAGETPGTQPVVTADWLYILNVKWGSDWVNEAGRLVDTNGDRGRQFYVGQSGESFENIQPGEFTFVLDNHDLRYDPYNSGGALYNLIEPGKAVEFSVKYTPTGVIFPIFAGRIKDIRPTSGRNQVQVVVYDALQWLADQAITIPTGFNLKVHEAIEAVLNAASYPGSKSIAASNCPITFFDPQEDVALDVIRALADAGLGTVFVDHHGTLKYYDLTTTGQDTTILDQAVLHKEITVTQPWDTVRNKITCIANRFGYGPTEEIWRMDEPVGVPAGSTHSFGIEFEQAKVQQPIRGVDYTDYFTWENFVVGVGFLTTHYFFTVYLTNITTRGATVNIQNNETDYLYLGFLTIRGQKLVNKKISFDATDATSASKGPRRLRIDSPWLQDRGFAAAYAPLLLAHLKDPSKDPVITIETRPDGLGIDLMDRINLTSAKLGIDVTYDVGYISYKWLNDTGQSFKQTFHLQNILYSTATITPQPFYPTLPPVPPVTPPPGVEIPPGSGGTGRAIDCTQDYPALAGNTGPFSFGGGAISNLSPSTSMPIGKWFRSIYHPSRTYIDVDGLWEINNGGVWEQDASFDFASVLAVNHLGQTVATGTLSTGMVADGIRRYLFNNTHPYFVARVSFSLGAVATSALVPPANLATWEIYNANVYSTAEYTGAGILFTSLAVSTPTQRAGGGRYTVSIPVVAGDYIKVWVEKLSETKLGDGDQSSKGGIIVEFSDSSVAAIDVEPAVGQRLEASLDLTASAGKTITRISLHGVSNSRSVAEIVVSEPSFNFAASVEKRVTIRNINVYNVCDDDQTLVK